MPILEKFPGGMAAGFHPDELKERCKKPSRPPLNRVDLIFRYNDF